MTSGFQSPNHTQVPNDLFDQYLSEMEKSELKVVLAVIRHTLGFHRRKTRISVRDLMDSTGLASRSIQDGAKVAEERGLLKRHQDGGVTEWEIIWNDPPDMGVDGVATIDTPEDGVYQPLTQPVAAIDTPAYQSVTRGVSATDTPSIKESSKETPKENSKEKTLAPAARGIQSAEELGHAAADQIYNWGLMSAGKQKFWNRAPEHLREILSAFTMVWCDVYERKLTIGDRGKFIKQAEVLYSDFGGEGVADFILESGKRHKAKGNLSLNGPLSIRYLLREVIEEDIEAEESEEANREFWDQPSAEVEA